MASNLDTSPAGTTLRFRVEGLCCATEARQIRSKLDPHPGVVALRIDPVQHTLDVDGGIPPAEVERLIGELGMTATAVDRASATGSASGRGGESDSGAGAADRDRRARLLLAGASGLFLVLAVLASREWVTAALALVSVVTGGWFVFPRGYRALLNRALDMNFLMSAAAIGALLIGEYGEAASVMFLFAVAQLLERASMDRARRAIRSLMELAPARARVLRNGEEVTVHPDEVAVGEIVVVRPGEKLPVDGEVVSGRTSVDQAPITGESLPVTKDPGDEVFAGTINGEGALEVRSSRSPADTTLARIIHAVEDAQATRAPSQTFVDRFAAVYTPAVVGIAVAVAVLPPLLVGAAWSVWVYRALALLVIACPCALVISTPVTVVSALAGAARRGILIKGGVHLETAGRARVVALDKTGTLTEGRPEVVSVVSLAADPSIAADRVLALAAAVESRSEHPLAQAIRRRARDRGIPVPSAQAVTALPGRGARAVVEGRTVLAGNDRLLVEEGIDEEAVRGALEGLEGTGRIAVLVASEGRVLGAISLTDRIRVNAVPALDALRAIGIEEVAVLTGDREETARAVVDGFAGRGAASGAPSIHLRSELLPEEKVVAIRELQARYGPVLMVGDGINDAPALATADVGIAMGAAGTDVALETADIALMADDLEMLPVMIRLARKAEGIIRANIAFALLVKAVFVVGALAGWVTLWMAVLADMGASLLVIANGMRALKA